MNFQDNQENKQQKFAANLMYENEDIISNTKHPEVLCLSLDHSI